MERINGGIPYYRFDQWPSLTHGVFTRHGGVSEGAFTSLNLGGTVGDSDDAVRENHARIYDVLGVRRERAVTVWMVHGVAVAEAAPPPSGRGWLAKADALITDQPGLALVMRYADCVPVLAHDPVKGVIGIAHAGWQGTVNGMAARLIAALVTTYGCRPADIQAGIGPAIGPARYQVGEEVVAQARAYYTPLVGALETPDDGPPLLRRDPADGSAYLDLWEANRRDLLAAGVTQVEVAGLCTAHRTDEFYSHRAEKGRTGRFGVVMML